MKIAFVNQKGGVGKTTLAVHVADALARRGKRVLLVDADPQASAIEWAAARESTHEAADGEVLFPVVALATHFIHKEMPVLAKGYDCVIIDGPPRVNNVSASVIMASDLVLIPVMPSGFDVWATPDIMELIDKAKTMSDAIGKVIEAAFVVNRKVNQTVIGKALADTLGQHPLPILPTSISQRIAFADSVTKGRTVLETDPNGPAAKEVTQLINDIMEQFDEKGRIIQRGAA